MQKRSIEKLMYRFIKVNTFLLEMLLEEVTGLQ